MVVRLATFVDIRDIDSGQRSFLARHDALLADGRRIVLLNDRGWSESRIDSFITSETPFTEEPRLPCVGVTRERIEDTARTVVGPDGAYADYTQAEMDQAHWAYLSDVLHEHGVDVDATNLERLPHEVDLSERLLALLDDPYANG